MAMLTIRYTNPASLPMSYGPMPQVQVVDGADVSGYWTLTGSVDDLQEHVGRAADADDLYDYDFA